MGSVSNDLEPSYMAAQILGKTHYGATIYSHILRKYYTDEVVMTITVRDCGLCRNPFNSNKETLHIWISKTDPTNGMSSKIARHEDTQNAIPAGDAFDFAELHYKQSGDELLKTINKEMNLHIGEKFDFYANGKKSNITPDSSQTKSPSIGGVGEVLFSFFKAPVRNTIPHKSISLLDAYNYIVGDYAKQRTEKLRSILSPLSCGEGSGERSMAARQFKASTFDYCTFSGTFQTRNDKALISHSGLLCIDFDHLQSVDLLRKQLLQDEYFETQLLFVSPSGDGLKWIISIDTRQTTHADYFAAVANYILQTYGVAVDKSGRDISRACFLPHDPQAYINPLYKPSTL